MKLGSITGKSIEPGIKIFKEMRSSKDAVVSTKRSKIYSSQTYFSKILKLVVNFIFY